MTMLICQLSTSLSVKVLFLFFFFLCIKDNVIWDHKWVKPLQSCLTLCDPIDGSPTGSPVHGILQARTLEWVAISFSNAWKWKWSHSVVSNSPWPHGPQPSRLLHPWDFPGKSTGVGCHCLLRWDHKSMISKALYKLLDVGAILRDSSRERQNQTQKLLTYVKMNSQL